LAFPLPPQKPASHSVSLSEISSHVTLNQQPDTEPEQMVFDTGLEHVGLERVRIEFRRTGMITDLRTGIAVDHIRQLAKKTDPEQLALAFISNCMMKIKNKNQIFHLHNMLDYLHNQRIISSQAIEKIVHTELLALLTIAARHNAGASLVFNMLREYCA
jgi:hypothetical protein